MKSILEKSEKTIFIHECGDNEYVYRLIAFASPSGVRFGVGVQLTCDGEKYEAQSTDLFSSHEGALRFLARLHEHGVTPANLADVIEDILSEF